MTPAPVSRVAEDYLAIIWKVQEWPGEHATTSSIAAALGVTASTVSATLKRLSREGLIAYEPYGTPILTDVGARLAVPLVRRHRLIETYLHQHLGLAWHEVHAEADRLEHAMSDRLLQRIDEVLGHPSRDPHGDAIPSADGAIVRNVATPLTALPRGAAGQVLRVADRIPDILRLLHGLGISPSTSVTVTRALDASNSMQVTTPDRPALVLSAEAAAAVWIQTEQQ